MDEFPVEIIDLIVSFLPRPRKHTYGIALPEPEPGLAPFATLSSKWQAAVERRTFADLRVEGRKKKLEDFARIVTPARRAYLRLLTLEVAVPFDEASVKPRGKHQQVFSEAFTSAVEELFRALADEGPDDGGGDSSSSSSDRGGVRGMTLELGWVASTRDRVSVREPRYLRQRIELLNGGRQLPVVKCVSRLLFCKGCGRQVALRTAIYLAKRLPCLQKIYVHAPEDRIGDTMTKDDIAIHRDDRHNFAAALVEADLLSDLPCREVSLRLEDQDSHVLGMNPRFVPPNFTNSLSYDPLSASIHMWSHNLVSLKISGVFDGSLFWPGESELLAMPASPWPCLRDLNVDLGLTTPTGAWYFDLKPGTNYRNVPCEDTMQPLFESWAKALGCMPVLEQATICFNVELDDSCPINLNRTSVETWMIGFQAPYTRPRPAKSTWADDVAAEDSHSPKLMFQNTGGWRPWKSTMDRLRTMEKSRFPDGKMVDFETDAFDNVTRA
ncbi:hypothetical protein AAE478_003857 [Parahypoxylon ruwenzoriense]